MNNSDALKLLRMRRYDEWNRYRQDHPDWLPDFRGINLKDVDFRDNPFNMRGADLRGTIMPPRKYWPTVSEPFIKKRMPSWVDAVNSTDSDSIFEGALYSIKTKFVDPDDASLFQELGGKFTNDFDSRSGNLPTLPTVFVSYSWKDKDVVHAIAKWLHTKGMIIKIDVGSFYAGENIRAEISRVMKECDVILIFYSNNSKDRPWVVYERELAYDLEMDAKIESKTIPRVIYVVLDDIVLPDSNAKNRIAIRAKGQNFKVVCQQIYSNILKLPTNLNINLRNWGKRTL